MITTSRLQLIAAAPETLQADIHGPPAVGAALSANVPDNWPPDLYDANATLFTLERLESRCRNRPVPVD